MTARGDVPPGVDPTVPSAGRLYDLFLGGDQHFEVDRMAAEIIRKTAPEVEDGAWANRGFLQRSARWMALEAGIDQFLDIGAGLPTRNNTHEAAQSANPDARTVYVDNDPMVYAHARSLLEGVQNVALIMGDIRRPDAVLGDAELRRLIDFERPVGLVLAAVLHFVGDADDPWGIVRRYMDALPSGSYLALSHGALDKGDPRVAERVQQVYRNATEQLYIRTRPEIERFFDGLELVPPYKGAPAEVTTTGLWGAEDPDLAESDGSRWALC
ncbi:MAG TPA: SAM-dependent methyltransferase, partial [Actinopolymorphaceae bacterium]